MAHQCIRCNTFYDDGSDVILKGCPCGAKLFFYVKNPEKIKNEEVPQIEKSESKRIEEDIREIIGETDPSKPVVLDLENIKMSGHGKYELDIVKLFKGDPVIYKVEDGKYIIDLPSSFKLNWKKNKD
jgi:uncharacterized protein